MLRRTAAVLIVAAAALAACDASEQAALPEAPSFDIDPARITVSGISSGAYMAGQLHVAHSATFSGAGLLAGGPYWCAEASLAKGMGTCVQGGDLGLPSLIDFAGRMATEDRIDAPANLADDRVWLFHGSLDETVSPDVVAAAGEFYETLAPGIDLETVTDVPATHGMPVIDSGIPCDQMVSPFLNDCDYDAAGALLGHLYGALEPPATPKGKLIEISQPGHGDAIMLAQAYLYVPPACAAGEGCGLHIAFHGCRQSAELVGDAFARGAGYNEWADANRFLVLYPQVASSKLAPMNPLGCWDWWGYTDDGYATRSGAQIRTVMTMLERLAGPPS